MDIGVFYTWLADFFDDYFLRIAIGVGILFLVMFVLWWLYRRLSKKDQFTLFRHVGGVAYASKWDHVSYVLKYFFVFPLYTFCGFVVFALCLFFLSNPTTPEAQTNILFISIVVVSTIRISAYVHESLAEDLAKLVPLSVLGVVVAHPSLNSFGITEEQFTAFIMLIPQFSKYILFTIMLEAVLRGSNFLLRNMKEEE